MPFDYKKEYAAYYLPPKKPTIVDVPTMNYIAVRGRGNPNEKDGEYQHAMNLLYGVAFTIKMSKLGGNMPAGYFEYSVAPLEGLWEMENGMPGIDYARKADFCWTAMIRQPEFVTPDVFAWACDEVRRKKKLDPSLLRFAVYDEGLCVQCMHQGPYDDEPATIARMSDYLRANGLTEAHGQRRHHEIYLKDPRRTEPAKLRTVLRIPVREA